MVIKILIIIFLFSLATMIVVSIINIFTFKYAELFQFASVSSIMLLLMIFLFGSIYDYADKEITTIKKVKIKEVSSKFLEDNKHIFTNGESCIITNEISRKGYFKYISTPEYEEIVFINKNDIIITDSLPYKLKIKNNTEVLL